MINSYLSESPADQINFTLISRHLHTALLSNTLQTALHTTCVPLLHAISTNNLPFASTLLTTYKIPRNTTFCSRHTRIDDLRVYTHDPSALQHAAMKGTPEMVQLLVSANLQDLNINSRHPKTGSTALHTAVRRNRFKKVNILLAHGADPMLLDNAGRHTPKDCMHPGRLYVHR